MNIKLQSKISELPLLPGCYIYKDINGEVIYVGKAIKLKNRVSSYFNKYNKLDTKTRALVDNINDFDFIVLDNEAEALILETNLIKKYKPKYNILLKDDKSYAWVKITKEDFPQIIITRDKMDDGSEYLGPYPRAFPAKEILKRLRKIFPYRTCVRKMQMNDTSDHVICTNKKPCIYYDLGLCKAPCASRILKIEYLRAINNIKKFLEGNKNEILNDIQKELKLAIGKLEFEKASVLKKRIDDICFILNKVKISDNVDDVIIEKIRSDQKKAALKDLLNKINFEKLSGRIIDDIDLSTFRIECYDISNFQGTNPVGSMVVMVGGQIKPAHYRRFKIQSINTPNDFLMHQEMAVRRFQKLNDKSIKDASFSSIPDLVIIDGGKGQLTILDDVLHKLEINIPHIGLAKKNEEIFIKTNDGYDQIIINKKAESLYLIQLLRDESHRFGITYHKKLRSNSAFF